MSAPDSMKRIAQLEARLRYVTTLAITALTGVILLGTLGWTQGAQGDVVRARQLVLEDAQGRARIILGAPLPALLSGGRELPARIGMAINDSVGMERFGLTLRTDGGIGMGFDAPPGAGDDRNRERINIVADARGGSSIRFLNRRTSVVGYLRLAEDDRMWLEFMDVRADSVILRRIGFAGEERVARPR